VRQDLRKEGLAGNATIIILPLGRREGIVQTLDVVDTKATVGPFSTPPFEPQKKGLRVDTPNGTFWHRFNFDGYGETRDGGP
jgi:hypothetical protein